MYRGLLDETGENCEEAFPGLLWHASHSALDQLQTDLQEFREGLGVWGRPRGGDVLLVQLVDHLHEHRLKPGEGRRENLKNGGPVAGLNVQSR